MLFMLSALGSIREAINGAIACVVDSQSDSKVALSKVKRWLVESHVGQLRSDE